MAIARTMNHGDARAVCIRIASDAKASLYNATDVFLFCPMEYNLQPARFFLQHAGETSGHIEVTHVNCGITASWQLLSKRACPIHDAHRYGIWRVHRAPRGVPRKLCG